MAKASSLAENLAKELECAVCLDQYKEPKVLPCLHSFCKRCLEGLLTKHGLAWKINCPSCRTSVEIPQGQVDSLQANFLLNNLLSMVCLHSEGSNIECNNCDSGDPASNRCTMCRQFLCEFCTAAHKRGRSTKTHRLMSLEEVKEEGPIAVTPPSLCKEHEGKVLKLFCVTCDEAICRDCTFVKHRDHKYTFVKDAFLKEKDTIMKILSETKTKASTIHNSLDGISEMKRNIHSQVEQIVKDITNHFNDLRICLNTRRDHLINEVEEIGKTKLKFLESQQGELEAALGIVQSSVEFTEKAFKNGSEVNILNMRKQMSTRLRELNSTKWQLEPCADDSVKFKADNQLKQDVATFGVITEVVTHAGASTVTMGHGSEGVIYNTLCYQPVEFTITAKERNGQKRTEGGDLFTATCIEGQNIEILNVNDLGDGTYTFLYTPLCQQGQCGLFVEMGGHDVQGSPFTWFIEKWHLLKHSLENNEGQIQLSEDKLVAQYIKIPVAMPHAGKTKAWSALQQPLQRPAARRIKNSPVHAFGQLASNSVPVNPRLGTSVSSSLHAPSLQSQLNQSDSDLLVAPGFGKWVSSSVGPGQPVFGQSTASSQFQPPQVQASFGPGFTSEQTLFNRQQSSPNFFGQRRSPVAEDFKPQKKLFGQQQPSPKVFGQRQSPFDEDFTPQQRLSIPPPPQFGQGLTSQQRLIDWQAQQSQVRQPQVDKVFTPQQALFGQTTVVDQSASTPGVAVLGPSQLDNVERRLYVVGSVSLKAGKHLWKAKLLGNVSGDFSFGVMNTGATARANWWVWNSQANQVLSPSKQLSDMTDCESGDVIEMYLDCDLGTLRMYNPRTKLSDIWHEVKGEVCPVFHMTTDGDQVSLLL